MNRPPKSTRLTIVKFLRGALVAGAAAVLASGCEYKLGVPQPITHEGASIFNLWALFFWAGVVVAIIMYIVILGSAIRYRKTKTRKAQHASQFEDSPKLEFVLIVIPTIIIVLLMIPTVAVGNTVDDVADNPDLTVNVVGFQWNWRFDYPGADVSIVGTPENPPMLTLPSNRRIRFVLNSVDVAHAFYVRAFLFKRDVIPGISNIFDVTLDKEGTFDAQCAEYCGIYHARMLFDVHVVPGGEFDSWLSDENDRQAVAGDADGDKPAGDLPTTTTTIPSGATSPATSTTQGAS